MTAEEFLKLTREYSKKAGEFVSENPEKRGLVLLAAFDGEESNTSISTNGTGLVIARLLSAAMQDDNLNPLFDILKLVNAMR